MMKDKILAFGGVAMLLAVSGVTNETGAQAAGGRKAASQTVAQVFEVRNRTELRAALTAALPLAGAEIRIHPGDYGDLIWTYKAYAAGRVLLVPATATAPTFRQISVAGSSGMALVGLRIASSASPVVNLSGTRDILFAGNHVTGAIVNQDPWDDGAAGMHIRTAQRVTVSNNQFEDLRLATYIQRSRAITWEQNTVRHVREGLNVAATTDLDIARNQFDRFSPNFPKREHPDAIQFWTSGETVGSSDVRITQNAMLLGGCKSVQGIFIGSETASSSTATQIRHSDFTIRGNVYFGSAKNALSVSSVDNAVVENNVIVASPYGLSGTPRSAVTDPRCSGSLTPAILSRFGSTTHRFARNVTHILGSTEGTRTDDVSIGSDPGDYAWTEVFERQPTADVPEVAEFTTRNPSAVRTRSIGMLAPFVAGKQLSGMAALARAQAVHKP